LAQTEKIVFVTFAVKSRVRIITGDWNVRNEKERKIVIGERSVVASGVNPCDNISFRVDSSGFDHGAATATFTCSPNRLRLTVQFEIGASHTVAVILPSRVIDKLINGKEVED